MAFFTLSFEPKGKQEAITQMILHRLLCYFFKNISLQIAYEHAFPFLRFLQVGRWFEAEKSQLKGDAGNRRLE